MSTLRRRLHDLERYGDPICDGEPAVVFRVPCNQRDRRCVSTVGKLISLDGRPRHDPHRLSARLSLRSPSREFP